MTTGRQTSTVRKFAEQLNTSLICENTTVRSTRAVNAYIRLKCQHHRQGALMAGRFHNSRSVAARDIISVPLT